MDYNRERNRIGRDILRLSVPAIVSNVTVPLLGLCDTAVAGHLGSEKYLAAIAVGSVMLNVVYWLFGFLRMGTTGLTAKSYGSGDDHEVRRVLTRGLLVSAVAGLVLVAFHGPLYSLLGALVHAEDSVAGLAGDYFGICIWGAPALLANMTISGWFVGMQSTYYPMLIAIAMNIVNICGSLVYVYVFGMGFAGIAAGTLTANWVGLAIAVAATLHFRKGKPLFCGLRAALGGGGIGKFFKVNVSLFFRSACITAVSLGVTAAGARMGAMTLAVNAVMMQFFTLFSFFMDGFAFSAEALVGKYAGAGDAGNVRKSIRGVLGWGVAMAVAFTLFYTLGGGFVAGLLTDDTGVREGVREMHLWVCLLPAVSVWAFLYDGFYVGITDTPMMLKATILATVVFFIVAFTDWGGFTDKVSVSSNTALWCAFSGYLLMRGVLLAAMWSKAFRRVITERKK